MLHAILAIKMTTSNNGSTGPTDGTAGSMGALSAIDLSWAKAFHTVNITRWSEPPGPEGFECSTWRVMLGAFGTYVSSNHLDLPTAITEVLQRAADEPALLPLLPKTAK